MLKTGDIFEASVKDLASDGRGVVQHPSGRTCFVPGVWTGEQGRFQVTGSKGRIGFARLLELNPATRHSGRVEAPCVHHGHDASHCGGCPWQFVDYASQLEAKQQRVLQSMARLGAEAAVKSILPSDRQLGYRNRAQLKTDGQRLGYVAFQSNQLVAVERCLILSEHNQHTLAELQARLPVDDWRPSRRQTWTTLDMDGNTTAATVSVNARLPFQQANDQQNGVMRQWLAGQLQALAPGFAATELFCGSGNLTEVISGAEPATLVAVEVVEAALVLLRERQLPNAEVRCCDLFDEQAIQALVPRLKKTDVLVLDPPRDGLKIRAPFLKNYARLKTVLYISCDLATFSRDLADFIAAGFRVTEVQPLDMFPHTPHIELMACLRRG